MNKQFLCFLFALLPWGFNAWGDGVTDKAMSKICRDTKTYISADVRAATEQEAYDEALNLLTVRITDYFKTLKGEDFMPDAVYLSQLSSHYERLTSAISEKRYRVVLYVKKSDLMPMGDNTGAMVLAKNDYSEYDVVSPVIEEPIVLTDTVVSIVEKPLNPAISKIASQKKRQELVSLLVSMKKEKEITGAAAFPMGKFNDFFVVIIDEADNVQDFLHFVEGNWIDVLTGETVTIGKDYEHCSAYWITIP